MGGHLFFHFGTVSLEEFLAGILDMDILEVFGPAGPNKDIPRAEARKTYTTLMRQIWGRFRTQAH